MPSVTLHVGALQALFNPDLVTIVGPPPQLDDGTDLTYVRCSETHPQPAAELQPASLTN
jgi:hypothetical protein